MCVSMYPCDVVAQVLTDGLHDSSSEWAEQLQGATAWDRELSRLQGVLSHAEDRVSWATTAAQAARDTVATVNEATRKATLAAHAEVAGTGKRRSGAESAASPVAGKRV
jgi:hypothetical protein